MADKPQPPKSDYIFDIFKLNKWFAIFSIALLIGVGLMIKKDYDREWKTWQRKFRKLEIEKTAKAIEEAKATLKDNEKYQKAKNILEEAEEEFRSKEREAFQLKKKRKKLEDKRYARNLTYQNLKAMFDEMRYDLEEKRHKHGADDPRTKELEKKFNKLIVKMSAAKKELETAEEEAKEADNKLKTLAEDRRKALDEVNKLTADMIKLERKQVTIERSIANDLVRDAPPLLDFIAQSVKVKELLVKDLPDDFNFAKVIRADACMTCHVAIDKAGYEDQANPLKTHPNLDLFLTPKSPHPINSPDREFGCTICHGGLHGGLTFTTAAHTPQDKKQEKEWKKKYDWHRMHHWEEPMLPLQHTEATCYGCHKTEIEVPKGNKINKGIKLVEHFGCYGCHLIQGWEDVRPSGPSLKRVASKVSEDWMYHWIRNPHDFRPTTNMPQFFDQSNTSDQKSKKRSTVEIQGIVTYLRKQSEEYTPPSVNISGGDADRGKALFGSVGCLGCHANGDYPTKQLVKRGPDLSKVGSKLSRDWLAAWLKSPKEYWHETIMPSLRLSDQEIADLTAYLMTQRDPEYEQRTMPEVDKNDLKNVTLDHLIRRTTFADAQRQANTMSTEEKLLFVGEKSIAHYGCSGCHLIGGFEDAKPIGTELTYEASKPLAQLDFGLLHMDHTIEAFMYQKIMNPRAYDKGRIRDPLEKLKMPNFHLSKEEGKAILTFLLSLRKYDIPLHRLPERPRKFRSIPDGRRLVRHLNCRGCHQLEGMGGEILEYYDDQSMGPPNLVGEGKKVQQDWLYHFLQNPTPIRPWLQVRMPTFGFTPEQTNTLVAYFRALDGLEPKIEPVPEFDKSAEHIALGRQTFTNFQCLNCHLAGNIEEGQDTSNLAPSFTMTPTRLRYEWFAQWLKDPQSLLPGTRMPNFFYMEDENAERAPMYPQADEWIDAVRDYIYAEFSKKPKRTASTK